MDRLDLPPAAAPDAAAPTAKLPHATAQASSLDDLLSRRVQSVTPPAAGQIVLGTLRAVPAPGAPGRADIAGLGTWPVAHSLIPLSNEQLGQGVALSLLDGGSAIVLGLLWTGEHQPASPAAETSQAAKAPAPAATVAPAAALPADVLEVRVDGERGVIRATRELELRCGEACILLMADGRIQLRGTYITSHASATQRIVGGSVHVN